MLWTIFSKVDLETVRGLDHVVHEHQSIIDFDTLIMSKNLPTMFLRGVGIPDYIIKNLNKIIEESKNNFFSVFISYSTKDEKFVSKLYSSLQRKGIRCYKWKEDMLPGKKVWDQIDQAIRKYDKLLMILSENSLKSEAVIRELERGLKKGKETLFPIRLDKYIFSDDFKHYSKVDLQEYYLHSFEGWEENPNKYKKALKKLIEGLKSEVEN